MKTQHKTDLPETNASDPHAPNQKDEYNSIRYESACCKQIHPDNIHAVAHKNGFDAPDYKTARILELGCGAGGNLIPFALAFPDTHCTGIDISDVEIKTAQDTAAALGLENIDFICRDIMDTGDRDGPFDYIICHGVFSWVPDAVREKILAICGNALSPGGLAAISYNALPGWHFTAALRDAMRFHTAAQSGQQKIDEARKLCAFLASESLADNPFRENCRDIIKTEAAALADLPDGYIYHDRLSKNNRAFYLREFAAMAKTHGLHFAGNANSATNEEIQSVSFLNSVEDSVTREQYLDFLAFRRFHISVLAGKAGRTAKQNASQPPETAQKATEITDKPRAWPLARYQVSQNPETTMVTSNKRESVKTGLFLNLLIRYADGSRTTDDLTQIMLPHTQNGDITLKTKDGDQITDDTHIRTALGTLVKNNLALMAQHGLLDDR